ncbi:MAG TPA: hypothetical protein VM658_00850 [bacterium]|nr:hypothetical protein [bacterium]
MKNTCLILFAVIFALLMSEKSKAQNASGDQEVMDYVTNNCLGNGIVANDCFKNAPPELKKRKDVLKQEIYDQYLEKDHIDIFIVDYGCNGGKISMKECYGKLSSSSKSSKDEIAREVYIFYSNNLEYVAKEKKEAKKKIEPEVEEKADEQEAKDVVRNRVNSSSGSDTGDGTAEKAETTRSIAAGLGYSNEGQHITISINPYGLLSGDTADNFASYYKLSCSTYLKECPAGWPGPIPYFLSRTQISFSVPTRKDQPDVTNLSAAIKFTIYGDRDPRNANIDKILLDNPPQYDSQLGQTVEERLDNALNARKVWIEGKYTDRMEDIANSWLITLSFNRFPLSSIYDGDSATVDLNEPMWMAVLTADKGLGIKKSESLLEPECNLTGNLKYQISEYPERSHGDGIVQNNQRLLVDASMTAQWPRLLLSVDLEGDWDMESDDDTYTISEVFTAPINDNTKAMLTFKQKEGEPNQTIIGLEMDAKKYQLPIK